MEIGREIDTRTITPARTKPAREAPSLPKRDWTPRRPAKPVEDPSRTPVKTPSKK